MRESSWKYSAHMPAQVRQTIVSRALQSSPIGMSRVTSNQRNSGLTDPYERESSYLVVLQLRPFGEQQLWVGGRPAPHIPYGAGSLMIYDLERNWVSNLIGEYDCLQFYVPQSTVQDTADDLGIKQAARLHCPPHLSVADPVVHGISMALLPALANPHHASQLFIDHIALALHAHLVHTYSEGTAPGTAVAPVAPVSRIRGGLAPWQEHRAKELMLAHLDGEISLAALAHECGLSRSHFAKAFRESTGMPPHRWLVLQRVDKARHYLLTSDLPLGQIATLCGFADQSHFTRAFSRTTGSSPGVWRRMQRG
ncbi:helix-turn-helix domain-containing protein [Paracidovorax citrulli]